MSKKVEIFAAIIIAGITAAIIGQIVRSLKGKAANVDKNPENGKGKRRTSKDTPESLLPKNGRVIEYYNDGILAHTLIR